MSNNVGALYASRSGAKPAQTEKSRRIKETERGIQQLLLLLAEQEGEIGHVRIDTRNFANYAVEIFLKSDSF